MRTTGEAALPNDAERALTDALARLDAAAVRPREWLPHQGAMALVERVVEVAPRRLVAHATALDAATHPLRATAPEGGIPSTAVVELAAQAMALHGALVDRARDPQAAPRAGYIAAVRGVTLHRARLDGLVPPLALAVDQLAGDAAQALYAFDARDGAGDAVAEGRITVVLQPAAAAPVRTTRPPDA